MTSVQKTIQKIAPVCAHPVWIEIDLTQFRKNIQAIRRKIQGKRLCMPVKANAYGHGLCEMGKAAQDAGVDALGVSCLQEGAQLRLAGIKIPIIVFGAIHEDQIHDLIELQLEFSISSRYKAEMVKRRCQELGRRCRVHVEVDTGMHRTGVRPATAIELIRDLENTDCFEIVGIYSHLATADQPEDPFAKHQIATFEQLTNILGRDQYLWHLANSGGLLFYANSHFDMVRPGLLCYGYFPDGRIDPEKEIAPCFSLKAKISYFKVVEAGAGISYGHAYKTTCQTRVVTIPVGYGDGYRRIFSNQAFVLIGGKRYRLSGTICMDQFMVDIGQAAAFVGDEVTLIGKQGTEEISLEELAKMSGTIIYELLCGFNERIPRIYV